MIPFWKLTPGGNPTLLFRSEDVPAERRAAFAQAVMSPLHLGAEQVGYIRFEDPPRLDMMGGEFCLNATRAFALLLAQAGLLPREEEWYSGAVEVSGVCEPVAVRVKLPVDKGETFPFAEACLHFNALPVPEPCGKDRFLVRLPGIVHLVQRGRPPADTMLDATCAKERAACHVEQEEAVGSIWITSSPQRETQGACNLSIMPVVWVRGTATLCHETACGSGTLAAALLEHTRCGATLFSLRQPSGFSLSVRMERSGTGWKVWVGGPVLLTARGECDVSGLL